MPCSVLTQVGLGCIQQGSAGHVGWRTQVSVLKPVFFVSLPLCLEIALGKSTRLSASLWGAAFWGDLPLLLFLGTSGHRRVWIAGRDGQQATVTEGQTRSLQRERAKGEGLKAKEKSPCLQKILWGQVNVTLGNGDLDKGLLSDLRSRIWTAVEWRASVRPGTGDSDHHYSHIHPWFGNSLKKK